MDQNQILELIQLEGVFFKSSMHRKLNLGNSSFAVSLYPRGERTLIRCLVQIFFFLQHYPTYISALYSHSDQLICHSPSNLLANLLVIKNPYSQWDGGIPSVQVVNLSISYEAKLIIDPLDT